MITGPRMDEITDMDEQTALICCCFSLSHSLSRVHSLSLSDKFKEVLMDSLSNVQYKHHNTVYMLNESLREGGIVWHLNH